MLAAITSQLVDPQETLLITERDFSEGGLPKTSVVKPTKVFTIHATLIVKTIGVLRHEKVHEILEVIRQFFS